MSAQTGQRSELQNAVSWPPRLTTKDYLPDSRLSARNHNQRDQVRLKLLQMPRDKTTAQIRRILFVVAVALFCRATASAQMASSRKIGDKTVQCLQTGIVTDLMDCGLRPYPYDFVFVGSISAITSAEHDEMELRLVPEEVFSGKPDSPTTVLTSQGLCFPKLAVGDRWLFYLRKEDGKPIVLDYYWNKSVPAANAQTLLDNLRRLQKIGEFAIVRGQVVSGKSFEGKPVRNLPVIAVRKGDVTKYRAVTDRMGRYEFPPLLPGRYVIQVRADDPHRPGDWAIDLSPEACWDLTPDRFPNQ
jgi:hypothetical protein